MFLLDLLWGIWENIINLFWFGKKALKNRLSIYIKSTKGTTVTVDLDPKWDIKEVKGVVAPKLGMEVNEVELILAGKVLEDSLIVEDCDLGEQSILHAVQRHGRNKPSRPLNETLVCLEEEGGPGQSENSHFYVYCTTCGPAGDRAREGKLRVRCSNCKSGAITLDTDPASWSDVLEPHRISGHCEQAECTTGPVSWAEFYFKCSEHTPPGEYEEEAISLYLIRPNTRNVPCLACTDVMNPVLVFPCKDGHTTCIACFIRYCTSKLRERKFIVDDSYGYTLPCPAGCINSSIQNTYHFLLLPQQLCEQYQKFGAEDYILKNGGVLCPRPGCGAGLFPDENCDSVKCSCGFVFCKKCLQGNHIGDCDSANFEVITIPSFLVDPSKVAQAKWDEASRFIIKSGTKPCPKCRTATERAGGCMHMVCTRCDFEWCWVCQTDWTRNCMGSHWFG